MSVASNTVVPEFGPPTFVVMLVYPGVLAMDIFGPLEAFASANAIALRPLYRLAIAGMSISPVDTSLRHPHHAQRRGSRHRGSRSTRCSCPAATARSRRAATSLFLAWLRAGRKRARRCGSICTGAFVLADAGLLDGMRATTHWGSCTAELARRYPQSHASTWTRSSCATATSTPPPASPRASIWRSAWSKKITAAPWRSGSRARWWSISSAPVAAQFSNLLLAQFAAAPAVRLVQEWALENLAANLSVKTLAKRAHMSERTFRRAFAEETGETPRDFVERIRIDAARGLFEEAQLSVQRWPHAAVSKPSTICAAPSSAAWMSRRSNIASASASPTTSWRATRRRNDRAGRESRQFGRFCRLGPWPSRVRWAMLRASGALTWGCTLGDWT